MERLPAFKSGNPTPATQRAPVVKTTPARVRPPVTTNPGPASVNTAAAAAGARPKTSAGGEQRGVAAATVGHDDPKTIRRGSLSNAPKR